VSQTINLWLSDDEEDEGEDLWKSLWLLDIA
jgi:hypothetical protein